MSSPYKTVSLQTLGCKLNYTETSMISKEFLDNGYAIVDKNQSADIYVINTCSVTDNADRKARKAIRSCLRKSPEAKIAVIGCYAQLKPDEISKIPGVSIVLGAEKKFDIVNVIESSKSSGSVIVNKSDIKDVTQFNPSYSSGERTRSFLKIQDGCDYSCSFCTIPLARGYSRSASIANTLKQVEKISKTDIKEIVLTGVNVGDFGRANNESFYDLIEELDALKGIERFRISSIEPNLLTDQIIRFISQSSKFLPHFHIPLQSGDDNVLKSMKRRYNTKLYSQKLNLIKSIMPYASIGIDVIVGYPTETESSFNQTFSFLENLEISYLHVFSYSIRSNTKSASIKHQVPADIISKRSRKLRELSYKKTQAFYLKNIGSINEVLIENYEDGFVFGYTKNYISVMIRGNANLVNHIFPVRLLEINDDKILGEIVAW